MQHSHPKPQSTPQSVPVEVFSALRFYAQVVTHSRTPDGFVQTELQLPDTGVHNLTTSTHSSLFWIDGLCAQSKEIETFITAVKAGSVPKPILSHFPRQLSSRFIHHSAYQLAHSPHTILSACGLAEEISSQALKSPYVRCPLCHSRVSRLRSPTDLLDLLMRDYNGEQISLTGESTSPFLLEWAATQGFSVHQLSSGKHSTLLDTAYCSAEALVPLSATLRSLWSVPEIVFHCRADQRDSYYSPTGYCTPCDTTTKKPSLENILKILSQGLPPKDLRADELTLEILPDVTISDILTSHVAALHISPHANLLAAQQILSRCGLGHFSLGQSTTLMSATDIARLTVAVSILGTARNPGALLLDLPRSILADSAGSALEPLLHDTARNRAVVVIGEPFASQPKRHSYPGTHEVITTLTLRHDPNLAPQTYKLYRGATLSLNRSELKMPNLFQLCEQDIVRPRALDTTPVVTLSDSPSCTLIPLLSTARHQHTRTLGDELGILERLAQLYAQSIDARMAGLSAKDLSLSATRTNKNLCSACKGLGVSLQIHPQLPRPHATACNICKGLRFKPSIAGTLFKGVSYSEILNKPLAESAPTLASLSKAKTSLELIKTLNLDYLPLGMPTALLSASELRRIELLKALCNSSPTKSGVIIIESPHAGFSPKDIEAIETLRMQHPLAKNCAWIEID